MVTVNDVESLCWLTVKIPISDGDTSYHIAPQKSDLISSLLGGIDELQVTLVEVSHGGNKPAADLGEIVKPSHRCHLWPQEWRKT